MSTTTANHLPSERESRSVAEASRQTEWKEPSFLKELFLGSFRFSLIDPFPEQTDSPQFTEFYQKLRTFLGESVDSAEIDASGEYRRFCQNVAADSGGSYFDVR